MKRILLAVALAAAAAGASAQVTFTGGSYQAIMGLYDPSGTTLTTPPVPTGGIRNAMLSTTAGLLTATFLGYEAQDTDTFFKLSAGTLTNKTAIPDVSSLSAIVGAVALDFNFTDVTLGTGVNNGGGGGGSGLFDSYMVLGTGTAAAFVPYTKGGLYDLVIGFNDSAAVDGDYDDFVVGVRVTAVPEPETYALMLAGLGAFGFIGRRRRRFPRV